MPPYDLTRRAFLAVTTTTAILATTRIRANDAQVIPRKLSPNEKLNVAGVGVGGQGLVDIMNCRKENVVALCDVDWERAGEAFYKLPETIDKVLPFVTLFAAMFTLWRLTRSQELIVARASGVSVWQFMAPIFFATLALGVVNITVVNPVGAAMIGRYWELESTYLFRPVTLELTGAGLWLRQKAKDYEFLLHADTATLEPMTLKPLMAFVYDPQKQYIGRIDGAQAVLEQNAWVIKDDWYSPNRQP